MPNAHDHHSHLSTIHIYQPFTQQGLNQIPGFRSSFAPLHLYPMAILVVLILEIKRMQDEQNFISVHPAFQQRHNLSIP
jgi:hypothetical protein